MILKHRNSQKRIYIKDACYFITCKTYNNFPYFTERIFCDLFMENLRICKQLKGFLLYGWVLVYDHFHLLVQPGDKWDYSDVIHNLKRTTSLHINQTIEGADIYPRLRYRWFPRLIECRNKFVEKFPANHPFPEFQWQKSFHDHYIRNENDFDYHMEYIAYNPIKHGLPDNCLHAGASAKAWQYVYTNPKYEDLTDEI